MRVVAPVQVAAMVGEPLPCQQSIDEPLGVSGELALAELDVLGSSGDAAQAAMTANGSSKDSNRPPRSVTIASTSVALPTYRAP